MTLILNWLLQTKKYYTEKWRNNMIPFQRKLMLEESMQLVSQTSFLHSRINWSMLTGKLEQKILYQALVNTWLLWLRYKDYIITLPKLFKFIFVNLFFSDGIFFSFSSWELEQSCWLSNTSSVKGVSGS